MASLILPARRFKQLAAIVVDPVLGMAIKQHRAVRPGSEQEYPLVLPARGGEYMEERAVLPTAKGVDVE